MDLSAPPAAHPMLAAIRAGERRAVARALSLVEQAAPGATALAAAIAPHLGRAHVVGLTGSPGAGKSTLVNALLGELLARGQRVAVVAVDPSSPLTGGAVLGDRVRMGEHGAHADVFIRSVAARGHLGGLSPTTRGIVDVFDAAGFDTIVVETVGAGQSEVEVMRLADTRIVACAPGLGDEVQAIKAGILEIADVLVVNKADRDGVQSTINALHAMLDLGTAPHTALHHGALLKMPEIQAKAAERWRPPIIKTIAAEGKGLDELMVALDQHREYLQTQAAGLQRVRVRAAIELETILRESMLNRLLAAVGAERLEGLIDQVAGREIDPYSAAEKLLASKLA